MSSDELLPKKNEEYLEKSYWEWRYERDTGVYDWFKGWPDLKDSLSDIISPGLKIIHLGCGNSALPEQMYDDYGNGLDITNIDFSASVIENMANRNKDTRPELKWVVMDILDLKYEEESFDLAIDKGTMDALLTPEKSQWTISDKGAKLINTYLSEIYRVLKKGGKFVYITFGQPHFRKPLLLKEDFKWELEMRTIGDFFHYFIYILTKIE